MQDCCQSARFTRPVSACSRARTLSGRGGGVLTVGGGTRSGREKAQVGGDHAGRSRIDPASALQAALGGLAHGPIGFARNGPILVRDFELARMRERRKSGVGRGSGRSIECRGRSIRGRRGEPGSLRSTNGESAPSSWHRRRGEPGSRRGAPQTCLLSHGWRSRSRMSESVARMATPSVPPERTRFSSTPPVPDCRLGAGASSETSIRPGTPSSRPRSGAGGTRRLRAGRGRSRARSRGRRSRAPCARSARPAAR